MDIAGVGEILWIFSRRQVVYEILFLSVKIRNNAPYPYCTLMEFWVYVYEAIFI